MMNVLIDIIKMEKNGGIAINAIRNVSIVMVIKIIIVTNVTES